ncbi:MAG TPA: nickel-dependent lactate racemase [Pyrinomonadaceae bacterium]|jgi:nickel-dependent lactate racemase|nr:nickel-dependent lactate racemase [Pyrinomonadaceae bacterium]
MNEIQLGYGRGSQLFTFDPSRFQILETNPADEKPLTDVEIGAAFSDTIESPSIDDLFSAGDTVLIVVSDATRATGSAQIINLLVRRLIQAGVPPSDIAIIFATGIHRRVTDEEIKELLTPFIAQRVRVLHHDSDDSGALVSLGVTAGGTPVEVNRALKDFSRVILTGAIGFHYFAGFTGGRKSICPGLASARTIEATHMLALDFETGERRRGVGTGKLDGNAVNEECERVAALIEPSLGVNAVVDERGRVVKLYVGDWRAAHRAGCEAYLATHSLDIAERRDLVIVSCGGSPWDINLIQAHKALEMAAQATNQGGTIVLLAECSDGPGRADFLKWFAEDDSRALAARLREAYEVNGQTAWSLLTKAERYRIFLISELPEEQVRAMRMIPANSLNDVMARIDNAASGFILPRGAALLPVLKTEGRRPQVR